MKHYLFPRLFTVIFTAVFVLFPVTKLYANNAALLVDVTRIKEIQGQLHYQLFTCPNNEETPWHELRLLDSGQSAISENAMQLRFSMLKKGSYIVRVFQDSNANGQLDFSSNGIPKEPTGFSGNPSLMLGYPSAQNSCFNYDEHDITSHLVTIKLNNKKKKRSKKSR
ncbi:hypothetical protein CXF85_13655 [Colwellia sp. 75C3]|uniref:DUF2141 domain-containing protein n=1 Tax=Colwellia sp. 75C3 TaxID=888425 RepID=UPI000C33DB81|nr:DUF2141 domain-containing protein [Colwellia sp. 75C3]PKG82524.1 hypothetical protein CXF85_13655 [Colwellia sp. 75C3]